MRKGFTLIEILIVIAIMSIISIIIVSAFSVFRSSQGLEKDTEMIVEVLRQARSQTLVSQNATSYGVRFASTTVTLFAGSTYSATDPSNQLFPLPNTDRLVNVNLTGGTLSIVFSRLTGETTQNGTITVSSPSTGKTKTITVYKTGLIEYQ